MKAVRRKELPELNDEFAKDLGDFQTLEELKEAIRKNILREREHRAQEDAKHQLLDKLVDAHDFPVPEAYIDRQIQINVENQLRALAAQGMDTKDLKLDWHKVRESQKDRAKRDVKASLMLDKIGEREADRADPGRGRPRGAAHRAAAARGRGRDARQAPEGRRDRQDRGQYPHREDAQSAVREGAQGSGAGAGRGIGRRRRGRVGAVRPAAAKNFPPGTPTPRVSAENSQVKEFLLTPVILPAKGRLTDLARSSGSCYRSKVKTGVVAGRLLGDR